MSRLSEEQILLAIELYKKGLSCAEIGKKYGVHHGVIVDTLRKLGIPVSRLKEPVKNLPGTEKIAYFAGLFDGEGNVGVYLRKGAKSFHVNLYITNTSEQLMKWLVENFGGKYVLKERAGVLSNLLRKKHVFVGHVIGIEKFTDF